MGFFLIILVLLPFFFKVSISKRTKKKFLVMKLGITNSRCLVKSQKKVIKLILEEKNVRLKKKTEE